MRTNVRSVAIVQIPVVKASAVVPQYDATGAQSGFGPSKNTTGVFLGRTDLADGDEWWVTSVNPPTISVTAQAGGTVLINSSQAGSFTWRLDAAAPTGATTGTKSFNQ